MNCPSCGTMNAPGAQYCTRCGVPMGGGAMPSPPMVVQTSGLAIAGLVCAFLCGLLGLILSIMAQGEIKRSNGRLTGDGLAMAGIIISIVNMVLGVMIAASRN